MKYFEVCISPDGAEDSPDTYWLCIKVLREPSLEEAESFLTLDENEHVIAVIPIDEADALKDYNFDSETNWPVFGMNAV